MKTRRIENQTVRMFIFYTLLFIGFKRATDRLYNLVQPQRKCPASPPGSRQSRVDQMKIPLNLPLQRETFYSPFFQKGGKGGFLDKRES